MKMYVDWLNKRLAEIPKIVQQCNSIVFEKGAPLVEPPMERGDQNKIRLWVGFSNETLG